MGIHSGDSVEYISTQNIYDYISRTQLNYIIHNIISSLYQYSKKLYKGIINIQLCKYNNTYKVFDINTRCSRTVPLISKVYNFDLVEEAIKYIMTDIKTAEQPYPNRNIEYCAFKKPIFSWNKFPNTKQELSPIMHSTGEEITFFDAFNHKIVKPIQKFIKNNS